MRVVLVRYFVNIYWHAFLARCARCLRFCRRLNIECGGIRLFLSFQRFVSTCAWCSGVWKFTSPNCVYWFFFFFDDIFALYLFEMFMRNVLVANFLCYLQSQSYCERHNTTLANLRIFKSVCVCDWTNQWMIIIINKIIRQFICSSFLYKYVCSGIWPISFCPRRFLIYFRVCVFVWPSPSHWHDRLYIVYCK